MKLENAGKSGGPIPATRASKSPGTKKPAKAPPPRPEAVAARLSGLVATGGEPRLWKEADLKRLLAAAERPVLAAALTRLREGRQVLALAQDKTAFYLFAEPLRAWLAGAEGSISSDLVPSAEIPGVSAVPVGTEGLFAVYARLVRQSGGFPDVKIAALHRELNPGDANALSARLVDLWREGRATFSQGDWSLSDEATRAAAVELSGERYLLVRLEE